MTAGTFAISGASGLIGNRLASELEAAGNRVLRLVRRRAETGDDQLLWLPEEGLPDATPLDGARALIHLAGENIASGRWTDARKKRLVASRVDATERLIDSLRTLERPPATLLCASAVGYYGANQDRPVSEDTPPGDGFLARLCVAWERAAAAAAEIGCRVVHARFGVVLARSGGALSKMLPVFKLGVGGRLGSGRQMFSWVGHGDTTRALTFLLEHEDLSGAFNITAPNPVSNADFTRSLGRALGRPTWLPVPALALEALFGEMARETLLASNYALPVALERAGFRFDTLELDSCLQVILEVD